MVEHGEDFGGDVVDGYGDVLEEMGVDLGEVLVDEVVEFGGVFDSCGPAADDGEVQEGAFVGGGEGVGGDGALLKEREDAEAQTSGVADVAEEVGVLADAWDAKGLRVGAAGYDELVVGDGEDVVFGFEAGAGGVGGDDGLAGGIVGRVGLDADGLVGEVDVFCPALAEVYAGETADRLEDGAELEGADGGGG